MARAVAFRHSQAMRSTLTYTTMLGALTALAFLGAGCGDDNDASAAAASEYCDIASDWAVQELEQFDATDPTAFRSYWTDYSAFATAALAAAPEEIRSDWTLKVEAKEQSGMTEILEKYEFDLMAMEASGTQEERAAFEAPPDVAAAQDRILVYESEVCGAQFPLAADISYAGEEPGTYCELVASQDEQAAAALASGDPTEVEAMFDLLAAGGVALTEAAPDVIKDDVAAVVEWTEGPHRTAVERHGFDIRATILDGTPQDRAAVNYADEEIRNQFARVTAYEEQVCYG
jgi:hypothetical protein